MRDEAGLPYEDIRMDLLQVPHYRECAQALGITLQEYLLLKILQKLDDLNVTAHIEE